MPSAGDQIGEWVVETALGTGGMGTVYRCHHAVQVERVAAVKVVSAPHGSETRSRFEREMSILASLSHPAIVRVLGWGEEAGLDRLYLTMEFIDGEDLGRHLARGRLPASRAKSLLRQVADALHYAHSHGIYHRDVKPSNIMIGADGYARLVDFGVAADLERTPLTRTGFVPGTLGYMAPELFRGGTSEPARRDVYALGLVLYEALCGRAAFPAEQGLGSQEQIARTVANKLESRPLTLGAEHDGPMADLVAHATHPAPEHRLPTMARFRDALDAMPAIREERTEWVRVLPQDPTLPAPDAAELRLPDQEVTALRAAPAALVPLPPQPRALAPAASWGLAPSVAAIALAGLCAAAIAVVAVLAVGLASVWRRVPEAPVEVSVAATEMRGTGGEADPAPEPALEPALEPVKAAEPGPGPKPEAESNHEPPPRPPETACDDLVSLEPLAMLGRLPEPVIDCLGRATRDPSARQTDRDKAGRVLLSHYLQRCGEGDCQGYESFQRYFFEEIGASDPDLMLLWASHWSPRTRDLEEARAEVVRWCDAALERKEVWKGGRMFIENNDACLRMTALATYYRWAEADRRLTDAVAQELAPQEIDRRKAKAENARVAARQRTVDWMKRRASIGRPDHPVDEAVRLCESLQGSETWCASQL